VTRFGLLRALTAVAIVLGLARVAHGRDAGWFPLEVPGGRETLRTLQVPPSRERAAVMIDLIRRLHFATDPQDALTAAVQQLTTAAPKGTMLVLPSPLSAAVWSDAVFRRVVAVDRLFAAILNDANARLLFHGLSGMDAESRAWFAAEPELLRWLYQHDAAVSAFALFAPAITIRAGHLVVPGGPVARQRWIAALGAATDRPERFVRRLFEHEHGRAAGLYFVVSYSDEPRRRFILGSSNGEFNRLTKAFAGCYPSHANAYPFVLRSHDPALLLLDVPLDSAGRLPGPHDRQLWSGVFERRVQALDAASIAEMLCGSESDDRRIVFETILAAQRVFDRGDASTRDDMIAALRGRRHYPSLFMALEQAGVRRPDVYAAVTRHADRVAMADDPARAITATRLFQGAVALTVNARRAGTLSLEQAQALLIALAALPFDNQRYGGAVGDWLEQWLVAVRQTHPATASRTAEDTVAFALAGPAIDVTARTQWDGEDYLLDVRGSIEQRLLEIRQQQGGVTLDTVVELNALRRSGPSAKPLPQLTVTAADEYNGDGLGRGQLRDGRRIADIVDFLLAHALASWAYAPHVGAPDSGAMVAGDGSLRHQFGVRLAGRARREQRWRVAPPPTRGVVSGSLLALEVPLATWSLRRLSVAAMPPRRQIGGNDLMSLMLTVALIDGRQLRDDDLNAIAAAIARGAGRINRAATSPAALSAIAEESAISPWRRAVLGWIVEHEPDRLDQQFSLTALARAGGLGGGHLAPWGTANIVTGCLCLAFPAVRVPELTLGRAADGIVGAQTSDLMLRIATLLAELKMPAALAAAVLSYAMRDFLDHVQPQHPADVEAFERQARGLSRRQVEDYLSAIATVGPLRPIASQ
jgi:hypothetical protein